MKKISGILITMVLMAACSKQPLIIDENTPMKTLLKASDEQITELAINEAVKGMDISPEDVSVEYILRDSKSQVMAIKLNIKQ